jgi:hypothetical protein
MFSWGERDRLGGVEDAFRSVGQFKLSRYLLMFELQFPESGMTQWKCQMGRSTYGYSRKVGIEIPCRTSGRRYEVSLKKIALSQQMLHE